jgi:hypothetical protein
MGVDTHGRIKGFVRAEDVFNFIRQKWDENATNRVNKRLNGPVSECNWNYIFNEHSEDNENWYWVETFMYPDDEGMLGFSNYHYTGHVEYNGTIGRYYKAYVCVWAGKDGDGDTRYFWTTPKKATLFAG